MGSQNGYEQYVISQADIERGQRIRQARVAANLSNGEFAKAMDMTPGSASQWESGRTRPNRKRLIRLCEVLKCSPDWIDGRAEERVPPTTTAAPMLSRLARPAPSKPLEYQLIDLLKEPGVDDDLRAAVWALIQLLSKRASDHSCTNKQRAETK